MPARDVKKLQDVMNFQYAKIIACCRCCDAIQSIHNKVWACRRCNSMKSTEGLYSFYKKRLPAEKSFSITSLA